MLTEDVGDVPGERGTTSLLSKLGGSNKKRGSSMLMSKKRKRADTVEEFTLRQADAKKEPLAKRTGLQGKATIELD